MQSCVSVLVLRPRPPSSQPGVSALNRAPPPPSPSPNDSHLGRGAILSPTAWTPPTLQSVECKCEGCPVALGADVGCKDESYVLVICIVVGVCLFCTIFCALLRCCQKKGVSA